MKLSTGKKATNAPNFSVLLSWRGWDFKIIRRECQSANCVNYELWLPGVYFFIHRYTA